MTCRSISREPGLLRFIYVDRIDDVIARLPACGGEVLEAPYPEGDLWVATVRDPAGNVIGLWQQGPRCVIAGIVARIRDETATILNGRAVTNLT